MLRKTFKFQADLAALTDMFLTAVTLLMALATHKVLGRFFPGVFSDFDMFWSNTWLYVLVVPVWAFIFDFCGIYRQFIHVSPHRAITESTRAGLISLAVLLGLLYILRLHFVPRAILGIHCVYTIVAIAFRIRFIQPLLLRFEPRRRILLAGDTDAMRRMLAWLKDPAQTLLYDVIGCILPDDAAPRPADLPVAPGAADVPGSESAFIKTLHTTAIDAVLVFPGELPSAIIGNWLRQCEVEGIEALLFSEQLRTAFAQVELESLAGQPALLFSTTPRSSWALSVKRGMDILLSATGLLLLSPLFLVIAILIKRSSPGPVFFSQQRSTIHGRTFLMRKFRTMIPNAEGLRENLDTQNEVSGPVFKIKNDPRITPIGHWLRRHSLDELPQLWNVLRGDMSIVGPRPPIPAEVEQYENWQRRRLSMRGGCTCLWQIGGRNQLSFEDWMHLDLKYIDNWSLLLDCKIILKTFSVIVRGTGC